MKNKKIIPLIAIIFVLSTILTACSKPDPINEDLISYVNVQMPTVIESQSSVAKDYESVTGKNFIDDNAFITKVKDTVIPNSTKFIAKAQAIAPKTEEVRKLHEKYMTSMKTQQEGFVLLLAAAEQGDSTKVPAGNEKLTQASKVSEEYKADMDTLAKAHGVEFEK